MKRASLVVNLAALLIVLCGLSLRFLAEAGTIFWLRAWAAGLVLNVGLYALAGGLTNWLAIYMLFDRIPFLYGSGVVGLRFADIKRSLERLLREQFFSTENISRFLDEEIRHFQLSREHLQPIIGDDTLYERLFTRLKEGLSDGNPIVAMAMPLLDKSREQIIGKLRAGLEAEIDSLLSSDRWSMSLRQTFLAGERDQIAAQVETLIRRRLDELTPEMVKQILKDMIERELSWLVIWGGILGGMLGLAAGLLELVWA